MMFLLEALRKLQDAEENQDELDDFEVTIEALEADGSSNASIRRALRWSVQKLDNVSTRIAGRAGYDVLTSEESKGALEAAQALLGNYM